MVIPGGFGIRGVENGAAHASGHQDFVGVADQAVGLGVADLFSVAERRVLALIPVGDQPTISGLQVKVGDRVGAGDVLLSIEAMKMETAIHAEADGIVAEVTVKPGDQIDSKDLLVRFE